jgi:hypothetical protein
MHIDELVKDVGERARRGTTTRQDVEDVCAAVAELQEIVEDLEDGLKDGEEVEVKALDMINALTGLLRRAFAGERLTREEVAGAVTDGCKAFGWDPEQHVSFCLETRRPDANAGADPT